ncbi:MAG: anti-sigma factor family protein [Planctomycetota bacterium]|jgi:hypothetical protein
MDCNRIKEKTEAYLFGELDKVRQERFEAHLEACPECLAAIEGQRLVHRALVSDSPEMPEGLVDAIMGRISPERTAIPRAPVWRWAVAAMLAVSLISGMLIFQWTDIGAAREKVAEAITFDQGLLDRESLIGHIDTVRDVRMRDVPGATVELVTDLASDSWTRVRALEFPLSSAGLALLVLLGLAAGALNVLFIGSVRKRMKNGIGKKEEKGGAA